MYSLKFLLGRCWGRHDPFDHAPAGKGGTIFYPPVVLPGCGWSGGVLQNNQQTPEGSWDPPQILHDLAGPLGSRKVPPVSCSRAILMRVLLLFHISLPLKGTGALLQERGSWPVCVALDQRCFGSLMHSALNYSLNSTVYNMIVLFKNTQVSTI